MDYFSLTIAVVFAAALAWRFRHQIRGRLVIWTTRRTTIAEAKPGTRVRVVGRAVAGDQSVRAPHSDRTCLASISGRHVGKRRGIYVPQEVTQQAVDFVIEDETGSIAVRPDHVRLELEFVAVAPSGDKIGGALLQRQAQRLYSYSVFLEGVVMPGDLISIVGTAVHGPANRVTLVGTAEQPLLISRQRDHFGRLPAAKARIQEQRADMPTEL